MVYRLAEKKDIPEMCRIRKQQLIDEGSAPHDGVDGAMTRFFEKKMADASLIEWLLEDGGAIVATAAILFMEFPPSFETPTGIRGYITNMYTAPEYRGKGIATAMLGRLMEEAKKRGVRRIWLGASTLGKPVYLRFGFREADYYLDLDL